MKRIKLFCIPYAGGSAAIFRLWRNILNDFIEIYPVELAGRGRRFSEPLADNFETAVDDIYGKILPELDGTPFAVFGHSMGSILAYESIHKIKALKGIEPVHAFFSGRYPPYAGRKEKKVHELPEKEFIEEIFSMGGIPKEIREDRQMMDLFIPILRNDYKILENYSHTEKKDSFNFDITVLAGSRDTHISEPEAYEWQKCTKGLSKVKIFEGGHFFINDRRGEVVEVVNSRLKEIRGHAEPEDSFVLQSIPIG